MCTADSHPPTTRSISPATGRAPHHAAAPLVGATHSPDPGGGRDRGPARSLAAALLAGLLAGAPAAQQFGSGQVIDSSPPVNASSCADVDGDGDADLLSASSPGLAWYANTDGLGTFGPGQAVQADAEHRSVCAADLDGDGDQDVLSTSFTYDGSGGGYPWTKEAVRWCENGDGLGTFGPPRYLSNWGQPKDVVAADLDGDGDLDAVDANSHGDDVGWYENTDAAGNFGPRQVIAGGWGNVCDVDAADLDGDGDQDVLYANRVVAGYWCENTGGGAFGPPAAIGSSIDELHAADVDGDGDLDAVAAVAPSTFGAAPRLCWYANTDGQGSFGTEQAICSTPFQASSVLVADLDGDGDPDCAASSAARAEVAWFANQDGAGSFGPRQVIDAAADGASAVCAADLDGDADPELLAAAGGGVVSPPPGQDHEIAWYENLLDALNTDLGELSLASGGTQQFTLRAGPGHGLQMYLLLGTRSGVSPGLPWGGLVLPLNVDAYFQYTLANPNSAVLAGTLGSLDPGGVASAAVHIPAGLDPALAGTTLHHAFGVLDPASITGLVFASNAAPLTFLP